MSNQNSLAIQGSGVVAQTLDGMSRSMQRQTSRAIDQVAGRAIVAHVHEEARAQLVQGAMINAGVLAMLNEHLLELAPLGASDYEALRMAYTIGASKHLMQW